MRYLPKPIVYGTLLCLGFWACKTASKPKNMTTTTTNAPTKYRYETVEGDPLGTKIYTLENGLKVYMSVNKDAPRIQTFVAVRTGSRNDPADATGLAHYLEHMVFKGTSKLAALDWEREQKLLEEISDLYEEHRNNQGNEEKRRAIYKQIDEKSSEAAKLVSANEYDRMISSLGAKGTNAYTSLDQTVYINDIPSNELEKWMKIEAERFSELVLRLFHTELEAVYEEFNISQARDGRKVFSAYMNALLPQHPYGTQTTIGTGEHLKNPSMRKIHEYFKKYYVPNNMAIILAGDFDPDQAVAWVEKYFGSYQKQNFEEPQFPQAQGLTKPEIREVLGKEKAVAQRVWLIPGASSRETLLAKLCDGILSNGKAGLIDLELVQKQKVGEGSGAFSWNANDYGFFGLYADPRPGQKLEEAIELMQEQVENLKKGAFEDWLVEALINNMEYEHIKRMEANRNRADAMLQSFLYRISWADKTKEFETLRKINKNEIVEFAKQYLGNNNHVTVYKREGEDKPLAVEKPSITPVQPQRDTASEFKKLVDGFQSPSQKAVFVDFAKTIQSQNLAKGVDFHYIQNSSNQTFELIYTLDFGTDAEPLLGLIARYLPYLGTSKYSPEALQQAFYKLGLSFDVIANNNVSYVTLSGLERSLEQGLELVEHIFEDMQANEEAWQELVGGLLKQREDAKKNKGLVLNQAMLSYARFGPKSPFTDVISEQELKALKAEAIVSQAKKLLQYPHEVFYYGAKTQKEALQVLKKHHKIPAQLNTLPASKEYSELATEEDKVYFVHFPGLAQAEVMLVSKGTPQFDLNEYLYSQLYNEYFGSGLSSIVFQEIRETRALAYSAYSFFVSPAEREKAHYIRAFVGTQIDKLQDALPALRGIIEDMPVVDEQIRNAANALTKKIESERIIKDNIYWTWRGNKKRGINRDLRQDLYQILTQKDQNKLVQELLKFQADKVKNRKYTILVLSDREKIDLNYLKTLGKFEELNLEQIFGY